MTPRPLILSMGDPAGIGPEITLKAWHALKTDPRHSFAVLAPPAIFNSDDITVITDIEQTHAAFGNALPVIALPDDIKCHPVITGHPNSGHAAAITTSIKIAGELCLSHKAGALITNPIAKEMLYEAGFNHPGHTEYLGALTQSHAAPYTRGPVMMLAAQDLRVGLVTVHEPLKDVAAKITTDMIIRKARVMLGALQIDYCIDNPRLALCGLNPHAGEGGAIGREEIEIIKPAAAILRAEGHNVTNAQSADTLFHAEARQGYDAVLAMYHDQGLIPVKTLDFHGGVNITLGGIAGQNIARADSLIAAIRQARNLADNRAKNHVG